MLMVSECVEQIGNCEAYPAYMNLSSLYYNSNNAVIFFTLSVVLVPLPDSLSSVASARSFELVLQ